MKTANLGGSTSTEVVAASTNQEDVALDRATIDVSSTARIMQLLASIYKEPIHANVREYVANAYDAHKEAGKTDPVRVHLPDARRTGENFFAVRDFGKGLTPADMSHVFKNYGTSTKGHSDQLVGGFGIGSKSAFALGIDGFQIRSVVMVDGTKTLYTYNYFKDDSGIPALELLAKEVGTQEPTGLEVIIPVEANNASSFIEAAYAYLPYFDPPPIVTNKDAVGYLTNLADRFRSGEVFVAPQSESDPLVKVVARTASLGKTNANLGSHCSFLVMLGNVPYPIDTASVARILSTKPAQKEEFESALSYFSSYGMDIYAKIGSAEIAPTRESLTHTVNNCVKIAAIFKAAKKLVEDTINAELDASGYGVSSVRYLLLKAQLVGRFNKSINTPISVSDAATLSVNFNRSMAADIKANPFSAVDFGRKLLDSLVPDRGHSYPQFIMIGLQPKGVEIPKSLIARAVRKTLKTYDRNDSSIPSCFNHSTFPRTYIMRNMGFFSNYANAYGQESHPLVLLFNEENDLYNELVAYASEINDGNKQGLLSNIQPLLADPSLMEGEPELGDNGEELVGTLEEVEQARIQREAYLNALKELKKKRARLKVLGLDTSNCFLLGYERSPVDYWKEIEVDSSMKGYYVPTYRGNVETSSHYVDPRLVGSQLNTISSLLGMTQEECAAIKIYGIKRAEIPKVSSKFPNLKPLSALFNELYGRAFERLYDKAIDLSEVSNGYLAQLFSITASMKVKSAIGSNALISERRKLSTSLDKYKELSDLSKALSRLNLDINGRAHPSLNEEAFKKQMSSIDIYSNSFNTLLNIGDWDYSDELSSSDGIVRVLNSLVDSSVGEVANLKLESTLDAKITELLTGTNDFFSAIVEEYKFLTWEIMVYKNHYPTFALMAIVFNRCLIEDGRPDKLFMPQN
jgi:hypothetical protein